MWPVNESDGDVIINKIACKSEDFVSENRWNVSCLEEYINAIDVNTSSNTEHACTHTHSLWVQFRQQGKAKQSKA